MDELLKRIAEVYDAVGELSHVDFDAVLVQVSEDDGRLQIKWDPKQGMSEARLRNLAKSAIANVAALLNYVRQWAAGAGADISAVDAAAKACKDFCVVYDLWNVEKHVNQRTKSWSGIQPRLGEVHQGYRLETRPEKGSVIGMEMGPDGKFRPFGDGGAQVVFFADIYDHTGKCVGDLFDFLTSSVRLWERLIGEIGKPVK